MASGGRSDSGASSSGGKTKRGSGRVGGAKRGAVNTKAKPKKAAGAKAKVKNGVKVTRGGKYSLYNSKQGRRERRAIADMNARMSALAKIPA